MRTEQFLKNIMDQIKEAQIKLGYAKETMRLYYPLSSLNALLGTEFEDQQDLISAWEHYYGKKSGVLGNLRLCSSGDRVEVCIPLEGVEYVHEQVREPAFLVEFIELFRSHPACTLEEICNIFATYNPDYVCEKMPEGSDFDYVLSGVDDYFYCVKMEMGHTIYHRFMREDYKQMM